MEIWTRVFRLPDKEWWILCSSEQKWGYARQEHFVAFGTPIDCMPLLPMLEGSYAQAVALVLDGLKYAGLPSNQLNSFPFQEMVHLALSWETEYWVALGVKWLETGYPLSNDLSAQVRKVGANKGFTIQLRHRALKLARSWAGGES